MVQALHASLWVCPKCILKPSHSLLSVYFFPSHALPLFSHCPLPNEPSVWISAPYWWLVQIPQGTSHRHIQNRIRAWDSKPASPHVFLISSSPDAGTPAKTWSVSSVLPSLSLLSNPLLSLDNFFLSIYRRSILSYSYCCLTSSPQLAWRASIDPFKPCSRVRLWRKPSLIRPRGNSSLSLQLQSGLDWVVIC